MDVVLSTRRRNETQPVTDFFRFELPPPIYFLSPSFHHPPPVCLLAFSTNNQSSSITRNENGNVATKKRMWWLPNFKVALYKPSSTPTTHHCYYKFQSNDCSNWKVLFPRVFCIFICYSRPLYIFLVLRTGRSCWATPRLKWEPRCCF